MVSPWCLRPHGGTASEIRKPTWRNTQRYSTTSAYSLTGPPVRPGCPSSSRPTTLDSSFHQSRLPLLTGSLTPLIVRAGREKQVNPLPLSGIMNMLETLDDRGTDNPGSFATW